MIKLKRGRNLLPRTKKQGTTSTGKFPYLKVQPLKKQLGLKISNGQHFDEAGIGKENTNTDGRNTEMCGWVGSLTYGGYGVKRADISLVCLDMHHPGCAFYRTIAIDPHQHGKYASVPYKVVRCKILHDLKMALAYWQNCRRSYFHEWDNS